MKLMEDIFKCFRFKMFCRKLLLRSLKIILTDNVSFVCAFNRFPCIKEVYIEIMVVDTAEC